MRNAPLMLPRLPDHAPKVRMVVAEGTDRNRGLDLRRPVSIIGRRPGSKIHLKHQAASDLHSAIINTQSRVYIKDLLSETGTYLNGLKTNVELLDDDDEIRIGIWTFRIKIAGGLPTRRPRSDDSGTVVLEDTQFAHPPLVFRDLDRDRRMDLTGPVSLMGGSLECEIHLEGIGVPRIHAILFHYGSRMALCNLQPHLPLLVNDTERPFAFVKPGDMVAAADRRFRVDLLSLDAAGEVPWTSGDDTGYAASPIGKTTSAVDLLDIESADDPAM